MSEQHSWIKEYWQGINDGSIIVGYYVKTQVEKLVSELDNDEYQIDLTASQKRIDFIEHECRHSEAPFAGKPFKLLLFQKVIIEAIFAIHVWNEELGRWVRKYQEILLVLGRKNGKAIDINTDIPTPDGWKKMVDLQIGDTVFTVDGTPAKIITVSPVRRNHACYRVTFEDGAEIVADEEHLWTVRVDGLGQRTYTTQFLKKYLQPECVFVPKFVTNGDTDNLGKLTGYNEWEKIERIEEVPSVPVKCIGIDHPSHLYLAGRKFTATHNTPLASAISLSEWVCGEMGTKILYGSNDYDQADLLYMSTDAMREAAPKLARCTHRNQKGIFWGGRKQKGKRGKGL